MTPQEGDTAVCKNCPEQIVYKTAETMPSLGPNWYHTRIGNWPEKNHVSYMMVCPRPYYLPTAEPR